jgi:uncharacterized protein (DUF885 family)
VSRVISDSLAALASEYWEKALEWNPLMATLVGDRRYDDRMPDISPEAYEVQVEDLTDLYARARAVEEADLSADERVTRLQLVALARDGIDERTTGFETWVLDPLEGPQVSFLSVPAWHTVRTRDDASVFVARVRAMGPYLEQHVANLERGHHAGLSTAIDNVRKVHVQVEELLAKPSASWSLVAQPTAALPDELGEGARQAFHDALLEAVETRVRPGFVRLERFVREVARPAARPEDRPGLCGHPALREIYDKTLRIHTSLPHLTAQAIHDTGLAEVARINEEMRELGARVLGTKDLATIQTRLRTDPALHFTTRDEVEAKAVEALRRAEAAVPRWFGRLPKTPCVVRRIEEHEEKFSTIAYYRQPATDGSRPGTYFINTYAPDTRPRYEAEALAFHEAVPGHHTQIAIAQELEGIPEFRKHTGPTAYIEGWALYTERLCDEMGLYSGDLDRIGMLSFDAWRACRLVVDTGLHSLAWSRHRAIEYMLANTALAANNIENEVDRYIAWPGQATAYKTGQLEILRLRAHARERLGAAFDIKAFHDAVLGAGAVGLETLADIVRDL